MIKPIEMQQTFPMTLHGGAVSTTTEIWDMLSACRDGDLESVSQMISRRPELITCQYNYTPPLHFAVREGHLPLVSLLLERQALDPRYKTYPFGDTLLTMAQDRGYEEIASLLQATLSNPQRTRFWQETGEIDYRQDDEQKQFDNALHEGKLRDVERFLKGRPDLARNELSSWAEGVLMMPAKARSRPLIELLLGYGARVPDLSKWGRFYYFRHNDIAATLLENGMNPGHKTWHEVTLLHDMAHAGDIPKAELLLDRGADINALEDEYHSTPLGLAARWGQQKMVAFLLKRGADPNKAGASWSTPLAWAEKKGHTQIADDLRAAGATAG